MNTKKINILFFISMTFAVCFSQLSFAIPTYVGIEIINLTDDPNDSNNCINKFGYGPQGKIRAISSILPDYPIYFEISDPSNSSNIVYSQNSTKDSDYVIGDTIWAPTTANLDIGKTYDMKIDIDAIKIYLDITDSSKSFVSPNNEYYTVGETSTSLSAQFNGCEFTNFINAGGASTVLVTKNKNIINDKFGIGWAGVFVPYYNIKDPSIGNFEFSFVYS